MGEKWNNHNFINNKAMTIRFRLFKKTGIRSHGACYSNIYVRIRDGREIDQTARTEILVLENQWDDSHERIKPKVPCPLEQRVAVDTSVAKLRAHIATAYVTAKLNGNVGDAWLLNCLRSYYNKSDQLSLDKIFDEFLDGRDLSEQRGKQYRSLLNIIKRYEAYVGIEKKRKYRFDIQKVGSRDLDQFHKFLIREHELCKMHPELLKVCPEQKVPRPRGRNTINDLFKKLRAIFNWCVNEGYLKNSPFDNYHITQELYGTPVCLTGEEIKIIAHKDLGSKKRLAEQRDVFIFQCNVGCRVSDLKRLKKSDIDNGMVSFIPSKTIKENPRTVVVPLNTIAREIIDRYANLPQEELLPFISVPRYNDNIKNVLRECGITREVTILDPVSCKEKKVPICEVASSHMARRTFVNNIYRHVKDPALVAALTGHSEGSKAFSRYRAIDDDVKRELVGFLE